MIPVDEAMTLILNACRTQPIEVVDTLAAHGGVLREAVCSDLDSPPFDKSMMDGFCLRYIDWHTGTRSFNCQGIITAGQISQQHITSGTCLQIMTGAAIPAGGDIVIPVEHSDAMGAKLNFPQAVTFKEMKIKPGQHVIKQGTNVKQGQVIVSAGRVLRAQEIAALAEAGTAQITVSKPVEIAILTTGNELVELGDEMAPGKIRNSNGPMLAAQVKQAGAIPKSLGVARDEEELLTSNIKTGLASDILLLSGGVSAGTLDLVPQILKEQGVQQIFHKIQMKPGKPLWFGIWDHSESPHSKMKRTYIFGLPGNPVSSMICFELFVKPLIGKLSGQTTYTPDYQMASALNSYTARNDRPTYHPVDIRWVDGENRVQILPWTGSSDLASTVSANGMAYFEPGEHRFEPGDRIKVYPWSGPLR
jgi:molybdopterin molybdotransferase